MCVYVCVCVHDILTLNTTERKEEINSFARTITFNTYTPIILNERIAECAPVDKNICILFNGKTIWERS